MSRIRVKPGALIAFSVFWLLCGDGAASALLLSAFVHELGHICAIRFTGGRIHEIRIGPTGAEIRYGASCSAWKEILRAAAGPVFGLAALFAAAKWIRPGEWRSLLFLMNLILAAGNMIPVLPLDGGRILYRFLTLFAKEENAFRLAKRIGIGVSFLLLLLAVAAFFYTSSVIWIPGAVSIVICGCKIEESGVI